MMDDVKLLNTKIFGEYNLIGNIEYDKNEILENWICRILHIAYQKSYVTLLSYPIF